MANTTFTGPIRSESTIKTVSKKNRNTQLIETDHRIGLRYITSFKVIVINKLVNKS